ncbi:hypothetical protein DI09_30p70 [Mitosporidium daphniae]|uniref:YjeF N-terminal domain-containing protein n=1 Tax=Mitosporidium daphniae TaxID=1485682 RepID=A0A098VV43_9MICR|nr:uncharacterized protein DI09_30p70 [Mitosporidium daphniae]KGG51591.1 hypothetical protein DI09_30p70 [Mitosporidium daphniae]|eukprot:XP_013238049.1 uncharacterized protein DI09_30p70 [Mitosporidium daphniae]
MLIQTPNLSLCTRVSTPSLFVVSSFNEHGGLIGEFSQLIARGSDLVDLEILEVTANEHDDAKVDGLCSSQSKMEKMADAAPEMNPHAFPLSIREPSCQIESHSPIQSGESIYLNRDGVSLPYSSLPVLPESLLNRILRFTSIKLGPNSVQVHENAARSILDLIRSQFDLKSISCVALQVDVSRNGAIALATARMLLNLGVSTVVGISRRFPLVDEKHFNFQADLAIKNGFKWTTVASITSPDLVITGLSNTDLPAPEILKNVPASNIISIGMPLKASNRNIHVDLILPTSLSMEYSNQRLYIVDIGISSRIVKMYLQKSIPSIPTGLIDFLFAQSSFIHLAR